ncbi:LysR family transcriptional regulator [Sinosporangium siamense]|uniref:LysR family transcriptional regulator n=1 Tax=Sinosporangium siamense TaxID=1367973 RepID=A0A919VDM4_9ACTN|nr:LysR family transcriptional regulator [Sinosporangium siamense]GII94279.1 LysR family transcriptional regulator [Sinosporangium siamense]
MDVNLRELRYFVAVAEELNVTRAAQRLFVSQPALSKQLRTLERRLGFALFDRVHAGMALTEQGETLLPFARETLTRWDSGVEAARASALSGTLVVGLQTAVGRGIQQAALRGFRAAMPGWKVSLHLNWTDPSGGLTDGGSDVAFLWLPTLPGLATRVLAVERRFVAMAEWHPLASEAEIPFTALRDEPFVALPRTAGALRDFWLGMDARDDPPVVVATASTPDETFEAISGGCGVALLAEGNTALYSRPGLAYRPVTGLPPAELAIAWREGDSRPQVRAFLDALP